MKSYNKSMILIVLTILSGMVFTTNILMDEQNPVQIIFPNAKTSYKIDLRFSFLSSSNGLGYKQYLALEFPKAIGTADLQFDQGLTAKYSCALTDGVTTYSLTADKPTTAEQNIAYCRLDDRVNNILRTGIKYNYKFTVQFVGMKISSTNYIRNLRLYTSTSNKSDRVIIDQATSLGTLVQYPNWEEYSPKPLDLSSISILSGVTTLSNIYPYQSFDLNLNLKSNVFLAASDISIVFRYPTDLVSAAQSVISSAILSTDPLQVALMGTLSVATFGTDGLILNGLAEDLIPNRQFQISLKGWKALDKNINNSKPLEILVYYKNTYSIISYVKTSGTTFLISNTVVTLSANHPEGWDIWRNGLWPMRFSFSLQNDLNTGGYVVLQHTNAVDLANKWNFVASTCDFSENDSSTEQGFSKRPVCYPLRTDFDYTVGSSSGYSASAVFFNMKTLTANKTYIVTVWGSADNCGGNSSTTLSNSLYATASYKQFQFKASIYGTINSSEKNETRFTSQQLLGLSTATLMTNKCYNNIPISIDYSTVSTGTAITTNIKQRIYPYTEYLSTNSIFSSNATNTYVPAKDVNLYQEIYHFNLINESSNLSTCTTCHLKDITSGSYLFAKAFIYGGTQINTSSYFAIKHDIDIQINTNPMEYLAMNVAFSNDIIAQDPIDATAVNGELTSLTAKFTAAGTAYTSLVTTYAAFIATTLGSGGATSVTATTDATAIQTAVNGMAALVATLKTKETTADTNCGVRNCKNYTAVALASINILDPLIVTMNSAINALVTAMGAITTNGTDLAPARLAVVNAKAAYETAKTAADLEKLNTDAAVANLILASTVLSDTTFKFGYNVGHFPGRVQFLFSKNWYTMGDVDSNNKAKCLISWGYKPSTSGANNTEINLIPDISATITSTAQKNYIMTNLATTNTISSSQIDISNGTCLPLPNQTAPCTTFKIISAHHNGLAAANPKKYFALFKNAVGKETTAGTSSLYFYSNCLKWTSPQIKSLYTYIDFQVQWLYQSDSSKVGDPIRNIRYIKLFPEAGVFNDNSSANGTKLLLTTGSPLRPVQATDKTYRLHFVTGSKSSLTGVCLIELSGKNLMDLSDTSSPVLGIWIGYGVILETDYTDLGATYPVAPLSSTTITPYGLQSGYFMNRSENLLLNAGLYNSNTDTTLTNTLPFKRLQLEFTQNGSLATSTGNNAMFYNESSYHFLMGSLVLVTQLSGANVTGTVGSESIPRPLMIPIYCPLRDTTNYYYESGFPTIYAAYINMTSYNTITTVNRILSVDLGGSAYSVVLNPNRSDASWRLQADLATPKTIDTTSSNYNTAIMSLRWSTYTSTATNADSVLYMYHGTRKTTGQGTICTGHIFMLHSSVTVDSTILAYTGSGQLSYYGSTKKFYFLGIEFSKAVFIGLGKDGSIPTAVNISGLSTTLMASDNTSIYVTGIKRLALDSFYSNNVFTPPYNKIGYFCSNMSAVATLSRENVSNYTYNAVSSIKTFLVDYNAPTTQNKVFTATISADKGESIYKNDGAGNMKVQITVPSPVKIPAGTTIKFWASGSVLTSNSICGLIGNTGLPVIECTNASNVISCNPDRLDSTFTVCCYNIALSAVGTGDSLTLSSLSVIFPVYPTGIDTEYMSATMFSEDTPTRFTWATTQSTGIDVLGTLSAKVTKIEYQQVIQDSGIGKAIITITLPREPIRNMILTVVGDLSSMNIINNQPRCVATFGTSFGSSWDTSGDILIDTCSTAGFSGSTSPIVLTTKNIVYKCGLSFTKSLTIMLWPVITVNWSVNPLSSNAYTITMKLNNSSTDAIALNTQTFNIATSFTYLTKPLYTGQWDTLCTVSSVVPKIPGEYADYIFDFDLDTNKSALLTAPNEATIFFPFNLYGGILDGVMCYYSGSLVNCSFSDDGILNIRFSTTLPVGSGKKIQITVVGVFNPSSDSDIYFPCTLNNSNFSTGLRSNLITGSGKLTGGIPFPTITSNLGSLRFSNIGSAISDINPRNLSTHTFRIAFDIASGLSTLPITIANTPQIIITFPYEYNLAWYSNTKASATIDEYTSNETTNLITKTATLSPQSITQSGNRITITLNTPSATFNTSFRYWDLKITNVINPLNNSSSGSNSTSGPYYVIITNSNYSSIYRTHTNTINYSTSTLPTALDSWVQYNKGNEFKFDNNKWVVDINATGTLNTLSLNSGRFLTTSFSIKSNTNISIQPRNAVITLTDLVFRTSLASYAISSSSFQAVTFMIGAPCGTAPGSYLVNFNNSDSTNFAPLAPILIYLDNTTKASINFNNPPSIPAGGSTLIYFQISEPNVDQLNLNFIAGDNSKNDSTAELSSVVIPVTTDVLANRFTGKFLIKNSQITTVQVFKGNDPNTCYSWISNIVTFNISGTTAIIPNNYDFSSSFKYFNSDTDSTLIAKNSIKFQFISPFSPILMDCALICFNQNYPSDDEIKNKLNSQTPLLRYYSDIFSSNASTDIIFDGLVRGQKYKLRCIIQSTQGDSTQRTFSAINLESIKTINGTNVDIIPSLSQKTQCAQFFFTTDPGQSTRLAIVNYCQKVFSSSNGWSNNGCIICTDSALTYTPPGLSFPTNVTCGSTKAKSKLRFLQTTPVATATTNTTTPTQTNAGAAVAPSNVVVGNQITYSVCPVPHPICTTDITGNKLYSDYFNQLITDLKTTANFVTNLNIQNVPINNTISVTDAVAPIIANLKLNVNSFNVNGSVQWSIIYTSSLNCFWQITESTTPPTNTNIVACTDASWCGNVRVTALGAVSTTNSNNLKSFTVGKNYGIYHACYNDIPYPQNLSTVQSVTFSIPSASTTVIPVTNVTSNNNTTVSSSFISNSYLIVFILLSLLI